MSKFKVGNIASLMCFLWLAIFAAIAVFLPEWVGFAGILACTVPMLLIKQKHRGATFGTRDCNTVKYKIHEYIPFFIFVITGTALISALTYLAFSAAGVDMGASGGKGFFYSLVFSCFIPAFFEEWLFRGGVLGALARHGGAGVLACASLFALTHGTLRLGYSLFAGIFITLLVYVTECIYLGMLLHFLNNLTSLVLSYISGGAEYITLFAILAIFIASTALLVRTNLFKDARKTLEFKNVSVKEVITPMLVAFCVCAVIVL